MDFFQNQDAARQNTHVMVVLFLLAVAGIVLGIDLVLAFGYLMVSRMQFPLGTGLFAMLRSVPPGVYLWGGAATALLIFGISLVQILQLMEGGVAVAKMVGARAVAHSTVDPLERRLLNVIEEMAIASGVRVPMAFIMDEEQGINAFAAGYNVSNAVVAVTRGTLETLSRDELQGVIGHEFSHILNGDMWLNIKLIGVLSGIVFIGSFGSFLMRVSQGRDEKKGALQLFLVGLAVFVIGYIGTIFARLIKAAVSRQREFLADASSVQFTRNPDGIAGALDQILASGRGTLIANRYAEDMSHMYFGQGITVWMLGLFATHPSIEERIERVRPGFQAEQYRHARVPAEFAALPIDSAFGAASGFAGTTRPAEVDGQRVSDTGNLWGRSATDSAKLVGTLDAGKVNFAARLIARLTPELRGAMRDAEGASAVLVATLLAPKKEVLADQADALRAGQLEKLADQAVALLPVVQKLGRGCDLMLIDLSLPAIKAGTDEDRRRLIAALEAVIHADRRVSLHEFVVLTLVKTQLATRLKPGAVKTRPLSALSAEIVLALSLVAHAGRKPGVDPANDAEVTVAFGLGAKVAGITDAQLVPKDKFSLDRAGEALKELMTLAPLAKAVLIKALFAVVTADGSIRLMEAELMRLLGAVLDCPLPPLIDDIDPESLAA